MKLHKCNKFAVMDSVPGCTIRAPLGADDEAAVELGALLRQLAHVGEAVEEVGLVGQGLLVLGLRLLEVGLHRGGVLLQGAALRDALLHEAPPDGGVHVAPLQQACPVAKDTGGAVGME